MTPQHLRPLDLGIVALYLLAITLFGLRFREKKSATGQTAGKSLKSYFLASNTIPWWAIALSIVSAETSTLTIISIPGVAFAGDFGFLQIVLGYMLGRIVVAFLFLPRYMRGEMLTAYQLIDQRFGHVLHKVTAGLFLLTRAAAEGVRVFAVSIVVGIAIGTRDVLSIAIISLLTLLYTFEGGMAAVIWTDVVQMAIYVAGTLVAVWSIGHHIPGGWATIIPIASAAGKFHLFNFALNLTTTYTFWAGILGGTFLTMASHGTDQLMVQRLLAARNLRESRLALLSSGVVIFIQFTLFLLIGAGLYVFAQTATTAGAPGLASETSAAAAHASSWITNLAPDRIFPTFIVREMPLGTAGLLIAAILAAAMSNLSAALNSLASTTVVDFYMHLRPAADARERDLISKSSTVLWALVLFAIAVYTITVGGKGHVVEIGLSIASVAYGCLLGVFLLGTLTKFVTQTAATLAMLCGFALNLWLWQGTFPAHLLGITIPHIAFTWYVLIGAIVTFALGTLFSLFFRKQSRRTLATTTSLLLLLPFLLSFPQGICFTAAAQTPTPKPSTLDPKPSSTPDFSPITTLLNDAIGAHHLPGAVVLIGHNNKVVFEKAYGNRKLANEPGLDGKPSPAEPMTEDTIFDMASLTKCLATATAVMQLYEQGKITSFNDPVEKYLPAFNESHDPTRAKVTLRMLLTHTSGEAPDVDLRDPWGLSSPDRAEGLHRALTTPLKATPGSIFTYSDINFILLGDLVETLSSQREDEYAAEHIFKPLSMTETRYLPLDKACGPHKVFGSAIGWNTVTEEHGIFNLLCAAGTWTTAIVNLTAPTAHDNEGTAATNPDLDHLLRGTVHDPTTRRMGGVAGHAGVFSTAHDMSLFASALLEKLLHNTGPFPLKQSTLQLMTTPEQPGHSLEQLAAASHAEAAASHAGDKPAEPGLAPNYPAIKGQNLRGFGWDIDTAFSKPRGAIFPIGSFGHTGFTGTSLWMDPASDTYVILLANAIHPRGNPPISNLRGQLATAAAKALGLGCPTHIICDAEVTSGSNEVPLTSASGDSTIAPVTDVPLPTGTNINCLVKLSPGLAKTSPCVLTGIDVLESTHFAALHCPTGQLATGKLATGSQPPSSNLTPSPLTPLQNQPSSTCHKNLGLLTNQTGLDSLGHRTVDILHALPSTVYSLLSVFTPEHGLSGTLDREGIASSTDAATHLPVISLYGKPSDRHPTHEMLKDLDAVLVDLQDAGVHFWTYEAATGYFLEAAALEKSQYHHDLELIILDRPNPIGGVATQGPVSDPGTESYVNYMPLPIRHGLTLGELMQYANATKHLNAHLTVIPMQHWQRNQFYADTGLPWVNPSPNLRSPEAALRYPALGLIETTNLSVGRGTAQPFSFFGAGIPPTKPSNSTVTGGLTDSTSSASTLWFHATEVANYLTTRHIPGVTFTPTTETIAETADHYPYHGQTIEAVRVALTDPRRADTPELGIEILAALHQLYPTQFKLQRALPLVCNQATMDAITRGDDPRAIAATWQPSLTAFRSATKPYLLYP
jgi:SSS family transporter